MGCFCSGLGAALKVSGGRSLAYPLALSLSHRLQLPGAGRGPASGESAPSAELSPEREYSGGCLEDVPSLRFKL